MGDKPGLNHRAYEPLPKGQSYSPYVHASESPLEFTIKSAVPGIIFGVLFGAGNAYLGLQAGLTISTSSHPAPCSLSLAGQGTASHHPPTIIPGAILPPRGHLGATRWSGNCSPRARPRRCGRS